MTAAPTHDGRRQDPHGLGVLPLCLPSALNSPWAVVVHQGRFW